MDQPLGNYTIPWLFYYWPYNQGALKQKSSDVLACHLLGGIFSCRAEFCKLYTSCSQPRLTQTGIPLILATASWRFVLKLAAVLCSFLLQLGLLDLDCSGYAPSCVAAASLSTALEIFGKPSWSPALQRYTAYTTSDLEPCKVRLRHAQCNLAAEHLRRTWHAHHENHGYDCYRNEWARALLLINCRTPQD